MSEGSPGAPLGNQNARKGREWEQAIKRALARIGEGDFRRGLDRLADKLVKAAETDESAFLRAIETVGDRIDGKPVTTLAGDSENPLRVIDATVRFNDGPTKD